MASGASPFLSLWLIIFLWVRKVRWRRETHWRRVINGGKLNEAHGRVRMTSRVPAVATLQKSNWVKPQARPRFNTRFYLNERIEIVKSNYSTGNASATANNYWNVNEENLQQVIQDDVNLQCTVWWAKTSLGIICISYLDILEGFLQPRLPQWSHPPTRCGYTALCSNRIDSRLTGQSESQSNGSPDLTSADLFLGVPKGQGLWMVSHRTIENSNYARHKWNCFKKSADQWDTRWTLAFSTTVEIFKLLCISMSTELYMCNIQLMFQ